VEGDFRDDRLKVAFRAAHGAAGSGPVDVARVTDPEAQSVLRALAMEARPLPGEEDMRARLQGRRLDARIDEIESEIAGLDPGSQSHSDALRRLVALQQEKRALGDR
jgi:hypothetical protein